MARPPCCRRIAAMPIAAAFGPVSALARAPDQVVVTLDEFEAVRLADLEELYQERAAERMGVSRPTFSRIIESAHRKIAEALVSGKGLKIEGGSVRMDGKGPSRCPRCGRERTGTCDCPRCRGDRGALGTHKTGVVAGPGRHCRRGRRASEGIT
jgi:predicted DNA-binding protein (UPF0251 family)